MKIKKLVVMCATIGMGATLMANSQQVTVAPSQGGASTPYTISIQGKVVKGMPYSAEVVNESLQTLSDGNRIVKKTTSRIFRDVEGRVRREEDRPDGSQMISISDPVAKLSWTYTTLNKTARETSFVNSGEIARVMTDISSRLQAVRGGEPTAAAGQAGGGGRGGAVARGSGDGSGRVVAGAGGSGASAGGVTPAPTMRGGGAGGAGGSVRARVGTNVVEEALPNKSIENLLCTGMRRTTTIAAGTIGNEQPIKIVSEEWTSIDLQILVLTDLTDPRSGRSTYKLLNVRRADPDATLFKVPADYTVVRAAGRGGN